MLVIARKAGQALCIGRDIRVEVHEIRNHQVKLTISAPADVPIVRTEIEQDFMTAITTDTDDDSGKAMKTDPETQRAQRGGEEVDER